MYCLSPQVKVVILRGIGNNNTQHLIFVRGAAKSIPLDPAMQCLVALVRDSSGPFHMWISNSETCRLSLSSMDLPVESLGTVSQERDLFPQLCRKPPPFFFVVPFGRNLQNRNTADPDQLGRCVRNKTTWCFAVCMAAVVSPGPLLTGAAWQRSTSFVAGSRGEKNKPVSRLPHSFSGQDHSQGCGQLERGGYSDACDACAKQVESKTLSTDSPRT